VVSVGKNNEDRHKTNRGLQESSENSEKSIERHRDVTEDCINGIANKKDTIINR